MPAPLSEARMRKIIREENLRFVRYMLYSQNHHSPFDIRRAFEGVQSADGLRDWINDYRDGDASPIDTGKEK